MHKLEIKLKQHTPLIHFQHDQDGATLRASEVKPKLDRFIIKYAFHDNFDECKEFLVGYNSDPTQRIDSINILRGKWNRGYRALNYKIKIDANDSNQTVKLCFGQNIKGKFETYYEEITYREGKKQYKKKPFPFLISDMGGKDSIGELMNMCIHNETTLIVSTTKDGLIESIRHIIPRFFALHTFGQRQTKGFGSFSVESLKIDNQPEYITKGWNAYKKEYDDGTWILCFELDNSEDAFRKQLTTFNVVDFYWRCLKSGINYTKRRIIGNDIKIINPERYLKAFLWTYLNMASQYKVPNNVYTWEKRKLKNFFHLETALPTRIYADNPNTAVFARGMMGCPVNYEYRIPTGRLNEKGKETTIPHTISIENEVRNPINDDDRKDLIERISSPIVFKPFIDDNKVYVAILFDETLIKKINEIPERKRYFKFTCDGNSTSIPIVPESIDYSNLIDRFNHYISSNTQYINSLWGRYEKKKNDRSKRWYSYVEVKKNEEGKVESRVCCGESISFRFIPRDFNWNNLLLPLSLNEEDDKEWYKHYVQIKRIKKA